MAHWAPGDAATLRRSFSADEVATYAALSGDMNPVHLDADYAAADPRFGQRIVHGMLLAGLISAVLGQELPGEGTIYLGQTVSFRAPVGLDEEVVARVEVLTIRDDKPIATLATTVTKPDGQVALTGEAVVLLPQR